MQRTEDGSAKRFSEQQLCAPNTPLLDDAIGRHHPCYQRAHRIWKPDDQPPPGDYRSVPERHPRCYGTVVRGELAARDSATAPRNAAILRLANAFRVKGMVKIDIRRIFKLLDTDTEIDASLFGFRYRAHLGDTGARGTTERRCEQPRD